MNDKYRELFTMLSRTISSLAEQVQDGENEKTATIMRDDYLNLYSKMKDNQELAKNDYIKLLLGAMILVNNLETQAKKLKEAVQGYNLDVIPKLQRIVDEAEDDDAAKSLANKLFI